MLEIEQITSLFFRCYVAIGENNDEVEQWLHENLDEENDYSYGSFSNSLQVMEYHLRFHNEETALAFKLRWIE